MELILQVPEVLELAFYLGLLNYFLGNLIKALPIPMTTVKKIGLGMIKDSLAIWILASSFTLILNTIEYVRGVLGISWTPLWAWFGIQTATIIGYINALKALGSVLGGFLGSVVGPLISSAVSILTTALTSIMALQILSVVVNTRGVEILALGIVLYSVPLRIFRRSGSLLISFIVVFSIALPGLPGFVEFLSTNIASSEASAVYSQGIAYPNIYVRDLTGSPMGYGLLHFYDADMEVGDGEPIAIYPLSSNGSIVMRNISWGLPVGRNLTAVLESVGWLFRYDKTISIPSSCVYSRCDIKIDLPGVMASDSIHLVIHTPRTLTDYYFEKRISDSGGEIRLLLNVYGEDNVTITYPESTEIIEVKLNGEVMEIEPVREWSWYGIRGYDASIYIDTPGLNEIVISYRKGEIGLIDLPAKGYASSLMGGDPIIYFLGTAITTVFLTLVFPTVYLSLLVMGTYSLARLLEGR